MQAQLQQAYRAAGIMGEREDYFDLWTQVFVTDVRKAKRNGVIVTEHFPVLVNVGCEFLDEGCGFEHTRQNLATYERQTGDVWDTVFGLGRGMNIAAWMPEKGWELFHGNSAWNKMVALQAAVHDSGLMNGCAHCSICWSGDACCGQEHKAV